MRPGAAGQGAGGCRFPGGARPSVPAQPSMMMMMMWSPPIQAPLHRNVQRGHGPRSAGAAHTREDVYFRLSVRDIRDHVCVGFYRNRERDQAIAMCKPGATSAVSPSRRADPEPTLHSLHAHSLVSVSYTNAHARRRLDVDYVLCRLIARKLLFVRVSVDAVEGLPMWLRIACCCSQS